MLYAFAMHVGYMTLLPAIGKFELDPRQIMWMLSQNRLPQTNIFLHIRCCKRNHDGAFSVSLFMLDIAIHVIMPELSCHCDVIKTRLGRH